MAGVVPSGRDPALLFARLAERADAGQASGGGIPSLGGKGLARLPRTRPAEFRAATAAAERVGEPTPEGGMGLGAGAEVMWAGACVWPRVRSPRRPPDEQH